MNEMLQFMLIIFGTNEYDWMGFKVTPNNPLTCHYIRKYHDGGARKVDNMAILTVAANRYLNDMEMYDIDSYRRFNEFFKEINSSRRYPTAEEYAMLNNWLVEYESKNEAELRKRIVYKMYNPNMIKNLMHGYSLFHPTNFRLNLQTGVNLYDERVVVTSNGKIKKRRKLHKQSKKC